MTGLSEYELLRNKNVQEREALFSTLFKELRELSEPIRQSLQSKAKPQRQTAPRQRNTYARVIPTTRQRRSARIRRSARLKRQQSAEFVFEDDSDDAEGFRGWASNDDDSSDSSDDSNDNCDPRKRLVVCFPSQLKFRIQGSSNESIDVWEGDENEEMSDFEEILPQRRFARQVTDMPIVLSPDEVTEEDIRNVAQKSGGKTYNSEHGTCCHQCRQKTMDTKTMCRSGSCMGVRGQFCGPCLKNRYGESAEKALKDPDWACPPCRGLCNCSICRTREGKKPTGILVPFVKSEGYDSVKEYLQFEED